MAQETFPSHFQWDANFAIRRGVEAYRSEDRVDPELEAAGTTEESLKRFLTAKLNMIVHGSLEFSYTSIRKFLFCSGAEADLAQLRDLTTTTGEERDLVLMDDRRESSTQATGRKFRRNWNAYDDGNPPAGDNVMTLLLNEKSLYDRLKQKRFDVGAERRVIFVADMTPMCALAFIATASVVHPHVLREYLHRYLSFRMFFGVHLDFGFALEFHLPYYALRMRSDHVPDARGLRASGFFMPTRSSEYQNQCIYEAQISFLIVGTDEWYWTAYCCVDTYFGSRESPAFYDDRNQDAPLGGIRDRKWPVWNPREYFLRVLSQRVAQVTREWANVVSGLEGRLRPYETTIFDEQSIGGHPSAFIDDADISQTKDHTWTVKVLRLLFNTLTKTIDAWDCFEKNDVRIFDCVEASTFNIPWEKYLGQVRKNMDELRFLRTCLQQKMEMFENMKNSVVSVSALVESRDSSKHAKMATKQGDDIKLLTMLTIIYLPFSLVSAVFSVTVLPKSTKFTHYLITLIVFSVSTLILVRNLSQIRTLFAVSDGIWDRKRSNTGLQGQIV